MAINKLPTTAEYLRGHNLIRNNAIRRTMFSNCFSKIIQNLYFAYNTYDDKTERGFKVRPKQS